MNGYLNIELILYKFYSEYSMKKTSIKNVMVLNMKEIGQVKNNNK